MKKVNKIQFRLFLIFLAIIVLIFGLCSCNTQKRITLTEQEITYKIDTIIKIKEIPIIIESKPIEKIVYQFDTIKIETERIKIQTFYDTVYKKILTKVKQKEFELPIEIDKTVKTKTKEKTKTKKFPTLLIIGLCCLCIGLYGLSLTYKKK